MLTQAEEGMKLFAAQNGVAAEIDKAAAEAYKADIEARTSDSFSDLCLRDLGTDFAYLCYRMIRIYMIIYVNISYYNYIECYSRYNSVSSSTLATIRDSSMRWRERERDGSV